MNELKPCQFCREIPFISGSLGRYKLFHKCDVIQTCIGVKNSKKELTDLWNTRTQSQWKPIETVPFETLVDVWVGSEKNPQFGARITNVTRTNEHSYGWTGIEKYYITNHLYPMFWMIAPLPPTEESTQ